MEYNDKTPSNNTVITKILLRQLLKSGDSTHMSDSKKPAQDYDHSSWDYTTKSEYLYE